MKAHYAAKLTRPRHAMVVPDGIHITVSFGVASPPSGAVDAWSWDRLVRRADAAMYRAKAAGRNRVMVAGDDVAEAQAAALKAWMHRAPESAS